MTKTKRVLLVAPKSTGGNFEYVAIPRQGLLYLSAALKQWRGDYLYEREIWFEDRNGKINPAKDLEGVDILLVTALINEAPRAYEITRQARDHWPELPIVGGGPHMSPLADEALRFGQLDVVVQREGEDIVGPLCDALITHKNGTRAAALQQIPGISFLQGVDWCSPTLLNCLTLMLCVILRREIRWLLESWRPRADVWKTAATAK
jgi:radical SAM superfamily enzyme YgiQ (UPF0313 family)